MRQFVMDEKTTCLSQLKKGMTVRVISVSGGRSCRQKLCDLGIVPGEELKIIQGEEGHPFLVEVNGCKVGIGFGMAEQVRVCQ